MFNYQKITSSKLLSFANFRQLLLAFCITGEYVFSSAEEIDYKIKLNDNLTTINNLLLQVRKNKSKCDSLITPSIIVSEIMQLFNFLIIKIGNLSFTIHMSLDWKSLNDSCQKTLDNMEKLITNESEDRSYIEYTIKKFDFYFDQFTKRDITVYSQEWIYDINNKINDISRSIEAFYYEFSKFKSKQEEFQSKQKEKQKSDLILLIEIRSFILIINDKIQVLRNTINDMENTTRAPSRDSMPSFSDDEKSSTRSTESRRYSFPGTMAFEEYLLNFDTPSTSEKDSTPPSSLPTQ